MNKELYYFLNLKITSYLSQICRSEMLPMPTVSANLNEEPYSQFTDKLLLLFIWDNLTGHINLYPQVIVSFICLVSH